MNFVMLYIIPHRIIYELIFCERMKYRWDIDSMHLNFVSIILGLVIIDHMNSVLLYCRYIHISLKIITLGNVHLLSEGGGSKMGGLRKIDEVRAGVYENY